VRKVFLALRLFVCPCAQPGVVFAPSLPMQADIAVHELMKVEQAANPERRDLLLALLEIDPDWRMHQVSDGQRRRVQIFLQLLSPYPIVLLDEITVDLDVITRSDFLDFLKVCSLGLCGHSLGLDRVPGMISHEQRESEEGKVTILYATHIFAGLEDWWTHIAYISKGRLTRFGQ
jgi:CCR4-NOT complex subunit CAF16